MWRRCAAGSARFEVRGGDAVLGSMISEPRESLAVLGAMLHSRPIYEPVRGGGPVTVEELLAKQEIRDVLMTYSRAIDRMDAELLASVYHPDAWDDHGGFKGTAEDFVAWVMPVLATFDHTSHFLGNSLIR